MLFASQAATAIANARTHRDEQRARADLEALVETSPVGVAVFDARSGRPVSVNREARRHRRAPAHGGPPDRGAAAGRHLPLSDGPRCARARLPLPQLLAHRRDVARRGGRAVGPGRAQRHRARQRDPHPVRRGRGRLGGRHHAGPGTVAGAGAVARGVPGHGEPRAACPAHRDQGLGRHPARRVRRPRPGRAARVPPHHPRAGRPHARAHRRPARCGAHRGRHALRRARALRGGRAGRPGAQHVPVRGRPAHRAHRPAARTCPG